MIEQLLKLELETCFTNDRGFTEVFIEVDGLQKLEEAADKYDSVYQSERAFKLLNSMGTERLDQSEKIVGSPDIKQKLDFLI